MSGVRAYIPGAKIWEPTGPIRAKKINAPAANRHFQNPRMKVMNDKLKSNITQLQGKVRSRVNKNLNVEPQPVHSKKAVQKAMILNKEINHQVLKKNAHQELKLQAHKSPTDIKKLAIQKKKLLALAAANLIAQKTQVTQVANVEETLVVPKVKKDIKALNVQVQKIKFQEKIPTPEKTKLENNIPIIKNKSQENGTCLKTENNNLAPAQDTKCQNTPINTLAPTSHVVPKTQSATIEKPLVSPKDDKVPTAKSVEEQQTDQSKTEESSEQKYELDSVLANAVEEELQDIMIQVWQELPDDPLEEDDRIAVDKLRNEVGDDLRRVLGLNITKRLLNVYNNLFLKMEFTCRPQMGCLTSFLDKYHINKFKRIDKNSNTFAAQMNTIEDFDNFSAVKELMCGEAKVRVTPCYKFTQCPEKLKTIYDDTYFYENTTQKHIESPKIKSSLQKAKFITSNENVVKSVKEIHIEATSTEKDKINKSITMDVQKIEDKDVKKDFTTLDNKMKTNSSEISKETKSKKNEVTNTILNETKTSKDISKDNDIHEFIKDKADNVDDDDFKSGVPKNEMDGEDELDDEDILALMSEGVVLDECSGSEDEN